jgi:hypothetical protein
MRLADTLKFVPVLESEDINAGVDCDSINMAGYTSVTFLITFCSDLAGNAVLTLYEGADDATKTTALTFNYRVTTADIAAENADVFGDWSTSAALTLTEASYEDRLLVVELDAASMTDGLEWLTLSFSADASAGSVTVVAILTPRYASAAADTALA